MYPRHFGTVDQFAVKALRKVNDLAEAAAVAGMNEMSLTIHEGVVLIEIFRRKAAENNRRLKSDLWTPDSWTKCCGPMVDWTILYHPNTKPGFPMPYWNRSMRGQQRIASRGPKPFVASSSVDLRKPNSQRAKSATAGFPNRNRAA